MPPRAPPAPPPLARPSARRPAATVHPGQDTGGGDHLAVVDIADPVGPADRRVVQHAARSGPASARSRAGRPAGRPRPAPRPRHTLTSSGSPCARCRLSHPTTESAPGWPGSRSCGTTITSGAAGSRSSQLPEGRVGDQGQVPGQRHRSALHGDGVEVERPGAGQHLVGPARRPGRPPATPAPPPLSACPGHAPAARPPLTTGAGGAPRPRAV